MRVGGPAHLDVELVLVDLPAPLDLLVEIVLLSLLLWPPSKRV